MPADDELERLRRLAYSRAGTPDDLRRLAELERPSSAEPEGVIEDAPPVRRRAGMIVVAAVAGLVGAAVGAAVTGVLTARQEPTVLPAAEASPRPESVALEVFDRVPTPDDDPSNLDYWMGNTAFEDIELRLLEQHDETRFYALRGSRWGLEEVCLVVESPSTSAMSCAAVEQFLIRGITMRTGDVVARWDPVSREVWFDAPS